MSAPASGRFRIHVEKLSYFVRFIDAATEEAAEAQAKRELERNGIDDVWTHLADCDLLELYLVEEETVA